VRACFAAGALAAGCEWELTETSPRYAEFRNDEQLARLFAANGAALGRDMDLAENGPRGMATASTDMGNVSQRVRAIHPYLGIGSLPAVNHQPAFAAATVTPAADRAVRDGAVLLAQTAIDAVLAAADSQGVYLFADRWIRSAARSATTMTVTTGFTEVRAGNTVASATRRPATPWTRNWESTTAAGSPAGPIRQVPLTW
jgi:hypothetical protein